MLKKILLLALFVAPLSLFAQKFAQFDYASIIQDMPAYKTAQTELQGMQDKFKKDLEDMQKELQTKYEKFQQEVNEKTPENIRSRRQQELTELSQKLDQARADDEKALQEASSQKMQPIITKVMDAINAVAKEGNYVYIMDSNAAQSAGIFINPALSENVTAKIRTKLGLSASSAKK